MNVMNKKTRRSPSGKDPQADGGGSLGQKKRNLALKNKSQKGLGTAENKKKGEKRERDMRSAHFFPTRKTQMSRK